MRAPKMAWHLEFARRIGQHDDLTVRRPERLNDGERFALAQSLATFQLGETGSGEHLFAAAEAAATHERYQSALAMFISEEQTHARLLGDVIDALDAPRRTGHWTDRVFVELRRFKSLRTEILTLLVAELVALTYYSALANGVPELREVFERIHRDGQRHVEFHSDTLPAHIARWPVPVRQVVRLLWNVLVTGASIVVALDHRAALRVADMSVGRFVASVWSDRRTLDRQLFGPRPEIAAVASPSS